MVIVPDNNKLVALPPFLKSVIDKAMIDVVDEELEKAKKRIDERRAEVIAGIVLHVEKQMVMETFGNELRISIRLDK